MLIKILVVGLGGFFGAILRFILSSAILKAYPNFPLGTLFVNVFGSFLMGILLTLNFENENLKLFITTGILGALTTFSTFTYENIVFLSENNIKFFILNIILNLFFCILFCYLGILLIKKL
ncbi:putative fluoride ion transporter [Campylobacter pinnipediorum subsp. caledonicus]|uniref:fluoride efflux transporter CrcB n=1 Tax=Campylobacter pinnipediorum TaxID=1965231 RepID=UPI00099593E0|nr:fluoride efflux transporter CrcB [Campylobacter pinnipediorum]AQW86033.1 putative fluoride ion transporter [Campylobacter pinnipediorum subsp. caledonicus]